VADVTLEPDAHDFETIFRQPSPMVLRRCKQQLVQSERGSA
jgi:hypothetical protein